MDRRGKPMVKDRRVRCQESCGGSHRLRIERRRRINRGNRPSPTQGRARRSFRGRANRHVLIRLCMKDRRPESRVPSGIIPARRDEFMRHADARATLKGTFTERCAAT